MRPPQPDAFITSVFDSLEQSNINYCILRNYGRLPRLPLGDIDVIVDGSLSRTRGIVLNVAADHGWTCHGELRHANVSLNLYLHRLDEQRIKGVNFEFRTKVVLETTRRWRTTEYEYIKASTLCESARSVNGLKVIGESAELVHLFCETVFLGKYKYHDALVEIAKKPAILDAAMIHLQYAFGIPGAKLVRRHLGSELRYLDAASREELHQYLILQCKPGLAVRAAHDLWAVYYRIEAMSRPSGVLCVFLGPDGSGKTHIADELSEKCQRMFASVTRIHLGNRPLLLPSLNGASDRGDRPADDQNASKDSGNLTAPGSAFYNTLRFIYHVADHIIHYYLWIRPKLAANSLVLSERYIYDYVAAPKRYIPNVPTVIRKIGAAIVPKPGRTFYIQVEPGTILKRKAELPYSTLVEEQQGYSMLLPGIRNSKVLNNNGEPNIARDSAMEFILASGGYSKANSQKLVMTLAIDKDG